MNIQSLVVVALRLMALNFLLRKVVELAPKLVQFLRLYGQSAGEGSHTSGNRDLGQSVSGYDVSQVFITFIVGVVLFVNGRRWAVLLARRQKRMEPPNQHLQPTPQ